MFFKLNLDSFRRHIKLCPNCQNIKNNLLGSFRVENRNDRTLLSFWGFANLVFMTALVACWHKNSDLHLIQSSTMSLGIRLKNQFSSFFFWFCLDLFSLCWIFPAICDFSNKFGISCSSKILLGLKIIVIDTSFLCK